MMSTSKDSTCEETNPNINIQQECSEQSDAPKNPSFRIMDDEQQYESASIIYGPGIPWTASPSPLHHATQAGIQCPQYVDYYPDYQNGGKYL